MQLHTSVGYFGLIPVAMTMLSVLKISYKTKVTLIIKWKKNSKHKTLYGSYFWYGNTKKSSIWQNMHKSETERAKLSTRAEISCTYIHCVSKKHLQHLTVT